MTACHCTTAPVPSRCRSASSVLSPRRRLRLPVHLCSLSSRRTSLSTEAAFLWTGRLSVKAVKVDLLVFLRVTACYSAYAIARPSVRLSHGWISQKRLNLGSYNFDHTVAPPLYFLRDKFHPEILTGASKRGGVGKTSYFLALCVNISKTVRDMTKVTNND